MLAIFDDMNVRFISEAPSLALDKILDGMLSLDMGVDMFFFFEIRRIYGYMLKLSAKILLEDVHVFGDFLSFQIGMCHLPLTKTILFRGEFVGVIVLRGNLGNLRLGLGRILAILGFLGYLFTH
jgi:hypothetical protein